MGKFSKYIVTHVLTGVPSIRVQLYLYAFANLSYLTVCGLILIYLIICSHRLNHMVFKAAKICCLNGVEQLRNLKLQSAPMDISIVFLALTYTPGILLLFL